MSDGPANPGFRSCYERSNLGPEPEPATRHPTVASSPLLGGAPRGHDAEPTPEAPVPTAVPAPRPVDLVEIASLFDQLFDGDPADRDGDALLAALVAHPDGDVSIRLLATGVGAAILAVARPPGGSLALALGIGGWQAPLDDAAPRSVRPSLHPQRRRVYSTTVIGGPDGDLVTVLRVAGDADVTIITDPGFGRVPEALRHCWARRPEAP